LFGRVIDLTLPVKGRGGIFLFLLALLLQFIREVRAIIGHLTAIFGKSLVTHKHVKSDSTSDVVLLLHVVGISLDEVQSLGEAFRSGLLSNRGNSLALLLHRKFFL
jgi:hypothetical protein